MTEFFSIENIAIIVLFLIVIIFFILKGKNKNEENFNIETFEETVNFNLNNLLKNFGKNQRGILKKDLEYINEFSCFYIFKNSKDVKKEERFIKSIYPEKSKKHDIDIIIFRIGDEKISNGKKIFYAILNIFTFGKMFKYSEPEFYLIDSNAIRVFDAKNMEIVLKNDVCFLPYGGCYISSSCGEEFLNDISFKKSIEENLTYLQNAGRKIIYLEMEHSKHIERINGISNAERSKFQGYQRNVLASGRYEEIEEEV